MLLALPAQNLNIAFLVALAFAVAASANLPSIVLNMFWRRFNTRGAVWSIYGGLISALGLVFFSTVMSGKGVDPATGKSLSLFPASVDFSWFPLESPGVVSIPPIPSPRFRSISTRSGAPSPVRGQIPSTALAIEK